MLQLDAIRVGYPTAEGFHVVVDDLSLSLPAGGIGCLLGASGCGKTTALRAIAGFEPVQAGRIVLDGALLSSAGHALAPERRGVGMMFQDYALFPHLDIAANVAFGLRGMAKAARQARVTEMLALVGLQGEACVFPHELSGGQQQRIALARALVNRPAVLLLDEPLGALDRQLREEMQLELKLLQSRLASTFVDVTHDQGEALSMSDRIAIMRDGRIEQLADADTIYARPVSAYVAAFVGQQNFFRGPVVEGGAAVESPHAVVQGTGAALAGLANGQAAVRPEFVRIEADDAAAPAAPNSVRGTLLGVSHLGETMQYLVRLGEEQSLISRRPTPEAPTLELGQTVRCSWSAESVLLFPADEAAQAGGYVAPPTA